jgi:hypothetical protein
MPASIILGAIFEGGMIAAAAALGATGLAVASFAINIVASMIVSKAFAPNIDNANINSANPGNRVQLPPAGSNKVPVIYGSAYVGGMVTDLSITSNNQQLYYVLTLAEVTNTETGGTPDTITFGKVYFGGKLCIFDSTDLTKVTGLKDESTGLIDSTVNGNLFIYLYRNGSAASSGSNTSRSAIEVMQDVNLTYQWDNTKLMSNCAFAIVKISYNQNANLTGIQQTSFQITNSRSAPGDCFYDYLSSTRYGAAIPTSNIDSFSLSALNDYCAQAFYFNGGAYSQARFKFDGALDTNQTIMNNMQLMASCCDCLIRYNEITGLWGVVVQSPTYTVALALNDSNIISAFQITPTDIASSFNIAEVKYPDGSDRDAFSTATFNLAVINPSLMYPNEPTNKQSIALPLVNNGVRAQYLANRFLKSGREDLIIKFTINYVGLTLQAGDIVTITNTNYGWSSKLFRINQVVENFGDDGTISVSLTVLEFNPTVYDDIDITQFVTAPNSGIGSPLAFGTLSPPSITGSQPGAATPSFLMAVTASSSGTIQYAELYYSAYASPTQDQLIFAGTTAINPNGSPYVPGLSMGTVAVTGLQTGDWYFFVRMVNSLGKSAFSAASAIVQWRPTTFQYVERWIAVAYADNATGTSGFSYSPRNKAYYGVFNNTVANGGTNPALYTWYATPSGFGSSNYLLYANRTNRKFSFNVGTAGYFNLGGAFVPDNASLYDANLWSAAKDPQTGLQTFIDLDARTGQTIVSGGTGNNLNDGFLAVTNNVDGTMKVNLHDFLNFGAGVYTKNFAAATLTIDIYGRVVGFTEEDNFYYTETVFSATDGQTSFSLTHTVGWVLVFRNGVLLNLSEYSETSTTIVFTDACAAGETVVIIYMRGVSTSEYYEPLNITIASSSASSIVYNSAPWNSVLPGDKLSFVNTGSPTLYTVSTINTTTKTITFTTTIAGATAGNTVYRYRTAGSSYSPFTRYDQDVTAITTFSPTDYTLHNGFEMIYVNGSQISEIDYNLANNVLDGFPASVTGKLSIIMFSPNNLAVPASNIANTPAYSVAGQVLYLFASNPLSMEVYANGVLLTKGSGYDYTASASGFTLATAYSANSILFNQQTFARIGAA